MALGERWCYAWSMISSSGQQNSTFEGFRQEIEGGKVPSTGAGFTGGIFGRELNASHGRMDRPFASGVVVLDHIVCGIYFPVEVHGMGGGAVWRSLKQALWIAFADMFLVLAIRPSRYEAFEASVSGARLEEGLIRAEATVRIRRGEPVDGYWWIVGLTASTMSGDEAGVLAGVDNSTTKPAPRDPSAGAAAVAGNPGGGQDGGLIEEAFRKMGRATSILHDRRKGILSRSHQLAEQSQNGGD